MIRCPAAATLLVYTNRHNPCRKHGRSPQGQPCAGGIQGRCGHFEWRLASVIGPEAAGASAQTLAEIGERLVGFVESRAQQRVAKTLKSTSEQIADRLAHGAEVRNEISDLESDDARSLFESVVEAAAESSEEKKCKLIANFYANVALDPNVSVDDALLYLRRIRAASWRQLVALRYFEDEERTVEREVIATEGLEGAVVIHPALGIELSELAGRGLEFVGIVQSGGAVADPASTPGGGTITSRSAVGIRATELGETVSRLGRLAEIVSTAEFDAIAKDLQRRS